jgi:hypothetical protein
MTPDMDIQAALNRLEQENRNLIKRLEKLEKKRGTALAAFVANVILLVSAGLLIGYLGLFPPGVERLPLEARTVTAGEFILHNGSQRARFSVDSHGLHVIDANGKPIGIRP